MEDSMSCRSLLSSLASATLGTLFLVSCQAASHDPSVAHPVIVAESTRRVVSSPAETKTTATAPPTSGQAKHEKSSATPQSGIAPTPRGNKEGSRPTTSKTKPNPIELSAPNQVTPSSDKPINPEAAGGAASLDTGASPDSMSFGLTSQRASDAPFANRSAIPLLSLEIARSMIGTEVEDIDGLPIGTVRSLSVGPNRVPFVIIQVEGKLIALRADDLTYGHGGNTLRTRQSKIEISPE